jgi:hypothetical protein
MLCLSLSLCGCSIEHLLSRWSTVWSPSPHGQFAFSSILKRWRYALVFPWPVNIAVSSGVISVLNLYLSCIVGKNFFVISAFVHSFHSFCQRCVVSSLIWLMSGPIGIRLNIILRSLSFAAVFARRSASSFPAMPILLNCGKLLVTACK